MPSLLSLPPELRHEIYEYVFGDKNNVIIFMNTHDDDPAPDIRHCICPEKGQKDHRLLYEDEDGSWSECFWHNIWRDRADVAKHRIPLLTTCRLIYNEAVGILWSHNPVHVRLLGPEDFDILDNIQAAVPPRQFHTIRSLQISFLHPVEGRYEQVLDESWFSGWNDFWRGVRTMKGLVHLQAWVKMDQADLVNLVTDVQERRLLAPLMDITIPDFRLEVTWPATEESEGLLATVPFVLTRKDEDVSWSDDSPACGNGYATCGYGDESSSGDDDGATPPGSPPSHLSSM